MRIFPACICPKSWAYAIIRLEDPIEIRTVASRSDLKKFVKVPYRIFQDSPWWVPPLIRDELEMFNTRKNPALEEAETRQFIAYRNGEPVGRIAAILSHAANTKYGTRNLRFGWFDTIRDIEVARALFSAAESWGKEKGMTTITGPQGFTDLDKEGMMISGFDTLPTIVGMYNHDYYPQFMEEMGFEKEIDYFEFLTPIPHETGIPPKLLRLADRIKERTSLRLLEFKNKKEVWKIAPDIFRLINEAFTDIYGTVPFSEKFIEYNVKQYIPFLKLDMLKVAVDPDGKLVAFLFTVPSLSRAFQKARGKLFPFGWFHLLRGLNSNEVLDFYMAAVKKEHQGKGIDLLMAIEITKMALSRGFKYAESNLELEDNTKVQALWKHFNPTRHRTRRIFKKDIMG